MDVPKLFLNERNHTVQQKLLPHSPAIPLLRIYPRKIKTQVHVKSPEAEALPCPSPGGWIIKLWYIHTMEPCPESSGSWMNLRSTLRERSWMQKARPLCDPVYKKCPERASLQTQKADRCLLRAGVGMEITLQTRGPIGLGMF